MGKVKIKTPTNAQKPPTVLPIKDEGETTRVVWPTENSMF